MPYIFYTGVTPPRQEVHWTPTIQISYSSPPNKLQIKQMMCKKHILVFFSKNAVKGFVKNFGKPKSTTIFSVGQATSNLIYDMWKIRASQPQIKSAKGMISCFENVERQTIIIPQGSKSRKEFVSWLQSNNYPFFTTCVYQTESVTNNKLSTLFRNNPNDYIIFTSPSTVSGFMATFSIANLKSIRSKILSIGNTTSTAITKYKGKIYHQSSTANIDKLIEFAKICGKEHEK